jgi:hypothetical protein
MDITSGYTTAEVEQCNNIHPHALETMKESQRIWPILQLHSSHYLIPAFEKRMVRAFDTTTTNDNVVCLVTLVRSWPAAGKEHWFWHENPHDRSSSIFVNWIVNLVHPFTIPLKIFVQDVSAVSSIAHHVLSVIHALDDKYKGVIERITVECAGTSRGYSSIDRPAMNRFLGYDMYWKESLQKYTVVWRIDSDAWFLEAPHSNPLAQMTDDFDIGFSMLGMCEVCPFNPLFLRQFNQWFLARGNLCHFSLNGNYGVRDTIMAGPFELYRLSCFRNATYTAFWMENDIDGMIEGKYGTSNYDHIREQFIKTIWIQASVAPMRINYFGELSMQHDRCPFRDRCSLQWKTSDL